MGALLAITWEPELRGILIVIIAVSTLCGSIYLLLATNLGARLGFLVAFTGLAGWMALMGAIWWVYGIGLKGPEPSWDAVPGKTVIQDVASLRNAGVLDDLPEIPEDASFAEQADLVKQQFVDEGWRRIDESEPTFGQAGSAAGELLVETDTFANGEFKVTNVFDTGGERFPMIGATSTSSRSSTGPTTPSSRSPRSSSSAPSPAGRRRHPRSTPPVSASTCTWCAISVHDDNQRP